MKQPLGLVSSYQIGAVLDASGYQYGDVWGARSVERLATRTRKGRSKGKTQILLPQTFGPFSKANKEYLSVIVNNADLIYPRDGASYESIVGLIGERDNVRIAPDFTATLPGTLRPEHEHLKERFCLVPNNKMISRTEPSVRDAYVPFMQKCLKIAQDRESRPFVLIHEVGDVTLGGKIAEGARNDIEVIVESDARAIKGIIGAANSVVSSRFHGLVNALCQGVPALGTGWSHKYEMLFRDYGVVNGVIPVPCANKALEAYLDNVLESDKHDALSAKLKAAADRQKQAIEKMWGEVFAVLRTHPSFERKAE